MSFGEEVEEAAEKKAWKEDSGKVLDKFNCEKKKVEESVFPDLWGSFGTEERFFGCEYNSTEFRIPLSMDQPVRKIRISKSFTVPRAVGEILEDDLEGGHREPRFGVRRKRGDKAEITVEMAKEVHHPFVEDIKDNVEEMEEQMNVIKEDIERRKREAEDIFESKDVELR